jgi:hypothetical protein
MKGGARKMTRTCNRREFLKQATAAGIGLDTSHAPAR